ncbi:MAG TPA: ROK family protein [Pyrinomonadaceae bacterium]|nr:ROK family protein [Pyrinomonadaceae bacterium]
MNETLAGIDIGGTKIAIATANREGTVLARRKIPTRPELGPDVAFENICLSIEEMLSEQDACLLSIGVGCPGPLDIEKGLVLSPANLKSWNRFPIVEKLWDHFGVDIALDNDANAAALGEYIYGAGRGFNNILYVTISTGIGGGIILNGEIHHGVGNGAGEVGHTIVKPDGIQCNCGSIGCLETICSGTHIARRIKERLATGNPTLIHELVSDGSAPTAQTLIEAMRRNDAVACQLWDETCRFLAMGLGNAVTLLAPEVLIIGGGIAAAGESLIDPLRELVPTFVSMIPAEYINIAPASLGQESGLCGAVALAKTAYSNQSSTHAA